MGFPGRNISRVPGGSHVPEQVPSSNFQVADMIGVRVSFASRDVCTSAQKPSTGSINKRNTSKNHHNTLITDGTRTHADSKAKAIEAKATVNEPELPKFGMLGSGLNQ